MKKILCLLTISVFLSCKQTDEIKKSETPIEVEKELIQTEKTAPSIPKDIEGTYVNSKETKCNFKLIISKKESEYFYEITTDQRKLNGKISFNLNSEDKKVYITFEGIKWAENDGQLDGDGNPKAKNTPLPVGVEALLNDNEISIQNSGNAMNSYTKFSDCGDKYITLKK